MWVVLIGRSASAQFLSPGPLHEVHKSLEGDDKCSECHSSGKKVSANACLGCHTELNERVRVGAGLHGKTYRGKTCESCHVDHLGRNSRFVRWPGGAKERFNHNEAGWTLNGAHAGKTCDSCHDKKNKRGAKTYLGLQTECLSCHKDEHRGRFGKKCLDCHNERKWKEVDTDKFNHDLAAFKLVGKHAETKCEDCHGTPAKWRGIAYDDCADCHKDPHKGEFGKKLCASCHTEKGWNRVDSFRKQHPGVRLSAGHKKVECKDCHDRGNMKAPSKGTACSSCHKPVHIAKFGTNCKNCHASIEWLGLPDSVGEKNHGKTRFPLEGSHEKVKCDNCHSPKVASAKRFRGLEFEKCVSCHEDKHSGAFSKWEQGECAQCHTVAGFRPSSFGVQMHEKTAFALDGRHVAAPCGRCHTSPSPRLDFKLPKSKCAECHDNPHGNQFEAEMKLGGCAQCHNTGAWSRPNIDHSTWPLQGAHARADCAACHDASAEDRKSGKGATYRGVPRQCEGCHQDNHAGQFRLTSPTRSCEFCHTSGSFKIERFEHTIKASYELTGAHEKLECAKCHREEKLKGGAKAVRYRLGYRECKDCHANPHPD